MLARLPFAWNAVGAIVLGVVLATWVWALFAPGAAAVAAVPDQNAPPEAEALFGVAAASSVNAQAVALPNVRLAGVFAGRPGFAVLELDGKKQLGVAVGDEIVHGVKLIEIAADHVVIEGGGGRQRIDLNGAGAAPGAAQGGAAGAAATPAGIVQSASGQGMAAQSSGGGAAVAQPPGLPSPAAMLERLPPEQREAIGRQLMGRGIH